MDPPTFEYCAEPWPGYKGQMLIGDWEWREAMFGMVPFFSKDGKDFRRTYNARSETADVRPTYRDPWKRRRFALTAMQRFFKPNYESGKPVCWAIERQDGDQFTVAALWDTWKPKDGETLHSFSMLTLNAEHHPVMKQFHASGDEKRGLVIVPPERRSEFLEIEHPRDFLHGLPADDFTSAPLNQGTTT